MAIFALMMDFWSPGDVDGLVGDEPGDGLLAPRLGQAPLGYTGRQHHDNARN